MTDRFAEVLDAWGLAGARVEPIGTGLINQTFAVVDASGERSILQQVNPIFAAEIHHNIVAVTEHLASKRLPTARLIPTRTGQAWTVHEDRVWRLQTAITGASVDALAGVEQARAAGEFVGRWHAALGDLEHTFVARREGVHDTPRHLASLREALESRPNHSKYAEIEPLALALLAAAERLEPLPSTPERVAHGDLKVSNLLFIGERPVALVDLDTVAPMALGFELGDAWRSWCNHATEDQPTAEFDLDLFAASLAGWTSGYAEPLPAEQRRALLLGPEWISLELACRFAADALFERYFGWNSAKFETRADHNLARARGQWSLHQAIVATRGERERLLRTV